MSLYLKYADLHAHYIRGPKNQIVCARTSLIDVIFCNFGHEMGRRGSPRAHTLGK